MSALSTLCFEPYRLAGPRGPLWRDGEELALRPKTLEVLWYLASHADSVVAHEQLLAAVWPKRIVSDGTLAVSIRELRRILGDDSRHPRYIRTVHRHGYRFIAPVRRLVSPGAFPEQVAGPAEFTCPELPGRAAELAQLQSCYETACRGHRQMVFVSGEAGIGKSTLIEAWLRRLDPQTGVRLGRGQCIEHYAGGESYLALLEALHRLCRGSGGGTVLETLRRQAPGWLAQLPGVAECVTLQGGGGSVTAQHYQRALADALEALGTEQPLVLVLEDLHWSDHSTVEALAVLARRLEATRLLVIGSYRPVELIVRDHPLKLLKQELQLHGYCREIALGELDAAAVRTYVGWHLPPAVAAPAAAMVYRRTTGQPLFMVHLTKYLAQHPELAAEDGAGPTEAAVLPEGLCQFIEMQLGRLSEAERQVLEAASVTGVRFTGATVSAALALSETEVEGICETLVRREQFIAEQGLAEWSDGTVSGRYAFRHALYQEVLYRGIGASRRIRLHRAIGERLEVGYGVERTSFAVELAGHFEQGCDYHRAVRYYRQAAANSLRQHASRETCQHLNQALALLLRLPESPVRDREERDLLMALGHPLTATTSWASPALERAYRRAHELCQRLGDENRRFPALWGLWACLLLRAEYRQAMEAANELACFAERQSDDEQHLEGRIALGLTHLWTGNFPFARGQLEKALALYDPEHYRQHALIYGQDPRVLCLIHLAWLYWWCGFPEKARWAMRDGLAWARKVEHPHSLVFAMVYAGVLHLHRGEVGACRKRSAQSIARASRDGFGQWLTFARFFEGWVLSMQGGSDIGITRMRESLVAHRAAGARWGESFFLTLLAGAYGCTGQVAQGLALSDEAVAMLELSGEGFYAAELHRVRGELMLRSEPNRQSEAEDCFQRALNIASRQSARGWTLRVATSLARLWCRQGRSGDAHDLLAPVYSGFTEGFETADLRSAKALLDGLTR